MAVTRLAIIVFAALLLAFPAAAERIAGSARVLGGGILVVGGQWVHPLGVWALEEFETCGLDDVEIPCGRIATGMLAAMVAGKHIVCDVERFPDDPRLWGYCIDTEVEPGRSIRVLDNLGRRLVASGWAFADTQHTQEFLGEARAAELAHRGLWGMRRQTPDSVQKEITGEARTVDGNTLLIGNAPIRLYGVEAPELPQRCERNGHRIACGILARAHLTSLTIGAEVTCELRRVPGDNRVFGVCAKSGSGALDGLAGTLNGLMVESGWALAATDITGMYASVEESARASRRGLWSYQFVRPAEWRRGGLD